jgi:hypothetical protein
MPNGLAEFLNSLGNSVENALRLSNEFAPNRIARAQKKLSQGLGDIAPKTPEPYDLEETLDTVRTAMRTSGTIAGVDRRHLKRSTWVLFYPSNADPQTWLGADQKFCEMYQAWIRRNQRASTIASLVQTFLMHYPASVQTFESWRRCLVELLASNDSIRFGRWRQRQAKYSFLNSNGPYGFANGILKSDESMVEKHLEASGLTGELSQSAFMRKIQGHLLFELKQRLMDESLSTEALLAVMKFCKVENGDFRFQDLASEIANSMLLPFKSRNAGQRIQDLIQRFLLDALGHPRLTPAPWHQVSPDAQDVMKRWLVGATLKNFFDLIQRTALDHHWSFRKAFWWAYHEGHHITDAWIVLGPDTIQQLRPLHLQNKSLYGEFSDLAGIQSNHSALIFRVGRLTVTEWSHNGKCRVWLSNRIGSPRLGERKYTRDDLVRGFDFEQTHHNSDTGSWQRSLSKWIRGQTNITIGREEYMP